jgi:Na+/H+-dicarboxylate symporter
MECIEKNAGVSSHISRFVLPLGIMVNMNGTALYDCVVVLFLAQAYGVELSFLTQIIITVLVLLTSTGVAGVPAGALVAIMIVLGIIGVPAEGIGMIMITERFLDMFRTVVNVFGDSCGAVVIAKTEKGQGILE